jgi:hypothetical protein
MHIIDGNCAATFMTSGCDGGRRIAYMKRGFFFPSRISQFKVECIIPTRSPLELENVF